MNEFKEILKNILDEFESSLQRCAEKKEAAQKKEQTKDLYPLYYTSGFIKCPLAVWFRLDFFYVFFASADGCVYGFIDEGKYLLAKYATQEDAQNALDEFITEEI